MANKLLIGFLFLIAATAVEMRIMDFPTIRIPGTATHRIGIPPCAGYRTYDGRRTAEEKCHDGLRLQLRMLTRSSYGLGSQLLPSIYNQTGLTTAQQTKWRDTLLSLLEMIKTRDTLAAINPRPTIVLDVLDPIISDTCTWLRTTPIGRTFTCSMEQRNDLKMKLELYKSVSDTVAVDRASGNSPIASLNGGSISDVGNHHKNTCDYWSSQIERNCTYLASDAVTDLHFRLDQDMRYFCTCSGTTTSYCCVKRRNELGNCYY